MTSNKRVPPKNCIDHSYKLHRWVSRLRLLGDNVHSTRIAFVEFVQADSAIMALSCSGMFLGSLPIRVSPSKTPVRPRIPRMVSVSH
ncbi:Poly(A) RNA polymerase cid11 [Asimina triloba]